MSPRLRLVLFSLAGAGAAVAIAVDIADESYGLATLIALFAFWLVLKRSSAAAPDAWFLGAVLVGYVVGNRGFAQLQPSRLFPLLPAEAVLLVAIPCLVIRMAFKRTPGIRRDYLNYSLLAWILVGSIRLPMDMQRFGVMALRDFATIYYALFFFIAQEFGMHAESSRLLRRALTVAFLCLVPVVVSILISPDFLVENLTFRGIPLIFHKSDLIATSLAAAFFWFWTRWDGTGARGWLVAAATSLLLVGAMASPRAGMFAVAVTTLLWLLNGRWRIAAAEVGIVAAASLLAVAAVSLSGRDLKTSTVYSAYEHALSIFDPAGSGTYVNGESGDPGGNNRFRLIWWRDVVEETLTTSPLMGLGFGSDLSTRMLADYDLLADETFAARSPHSIVVTVIGRMGMVGLAAWLAVSCSMFVLAWRLLKRGDPDGMGLASIVVVIWLSACFGVVLEGPMGAVIFWTVLGLANAFLHRQAPPPPAPAVRRTGEAAPREWQVAKAAALDTQSEPR